MTRHSIAGAIIVVLNVGVRCAWGLVPGGAGLPLAAQQLEEAQKQQASRPPAEALAPAAVSAVVPPADYVIGLDDILTVTFWREKDLSGVVVVRPDGRIALPLVKEIEAAGLTPQQLTEKITAAAARFFEDPNVTVAVTEIKSRKVFITGRVGKPGAYVLTSRTTLLQLIAMAGGLQEYADSKHIVIVRTVSGRPVTYTFNYKDVTRRRGLRDNIELIPGDTVVVP